MTRADPDGRGGHVEVQAMVRLAEATGDDDPRAALAAARELRRAAERAEATVVRRARLQGLAWAEIAEQLGVTRQAVHKRYGRR
ncbi:ECF-type sigma factor [Terracoccus luteus]|uniref:ECF-type sigma factor n=1 Tax=Terracoccus luteus TaxID=53356 RepID=UPI0021A8C2B6|nr:ECF-type sigma factor [Terracoccus luteus]